MHKHKKNIRLTFNKTSVHLASLKPEDILLHAVARRVAKELDRRATSLKAFPLAVDASGALAARCRPRERMGVNAIGSDLGSTMTAPRRVRLDFSALAAEQVEAELFASPSNHPGVKERIGGEI